MFLSVFCVVHMSVYRHVCLSVRLSVCLSDCLSVFQSACPSFCLSVCIYVDCLNVCLIMRPDVCQSIYLSACLSVCLFVCLSVCLFVCVSCPVRCARGRWRRVSKSPKSKSCSISCTTADYSHYFIYDNRNSNCIETNESHLKEFVILPADQIWLGLIHKVSGVPVHITQYKNKDNFIDIICKTQRRSEIKCIFKEANNKKIVLDKWHNNKPKFWKPSDVQT